MRVFKAADAVFLAERFAVLDPFCDVGEVLMNIKALYSRENVVGRLIIFSCVEKKLRLQ